MREWFLKVPGGVPAARVDGGLMLLGSLGGEGLPSVVRLPPDLGGSEARVVRAFAADCPRCHDPVRHLLLDEHGLKLDEGARLCVAECVRCAFLWHTRKEVPNG